MILAELQLGRIVQADEQVCVLSELAIHVLILKVESSGFDTKLPTANGDLPVVKAYKTTNESVVCDLHRRQIFQLGCEHGL